MSCDPNSRPVFACSERAIDSAMLLASGADYRPIPSAGLSFRPAALFNCLLQARRGRKVAFNVIANEKIGVVVALGGFVTIPVVQAARKAGVPVLLVNLDAVPGRANGWVARRSDRILSAVTTSHSDIRTAEIVGMPIRRSTMAAGEPADCRARLGLEPDMPVLLVTGASQGAQSLNRFVVEFCRRNAALLDGWQILHLSGSGNEQELRNEYSSIDLSVRVIPFLDRMGVAWGAATAAVSRAGASSIAESAANLVPTLFVPYPYHKDHHQKANAQPLVDEGAALLATDLVDPMRNQETIGRSLFSLLQDPEARHRITESLSSRDRTSAASRIARELLQMRGAPR